MLQLPVKSTVNVLVVAPPARPLFWKQVEAVSSMRAETVGIDARGCEDAIVIESVLDSDSAAVAVKVTA
jgi:hypothetical protein